MLCAESTMYLRALADTTMYRVIPVTLTSICVTFLCHDIYVSIFFVI
jgi:hypothetical protein